MPWIGAAPSCEEAQVVVQASEQTAKASPEPAQGAAEPTFGSPGGVIGA